MKRFDPLFSFRIPNIAEKDKLEILKNLKITMIDGLWTSYALCPNMGFA
jgi:hypothetical protein